MDSEPNRIALAVTGDIIDGFQSFTTAFGRMTRQARHCFESRDWAGGRRNTLSRLELYSSSVSGTVHRICRHFEGITDPRPIWEEVKSRFAEYTQQRPDGELGCTFYNSVNRKVLDTIGFDPAMAFQDPVIPTHLFSKARTFLFQWDVARIEPRTIEQLFTRYAFEVPFENRFEDARLCVAHLESCLPVAIKPRDPIRIEMVRAPFFRGMSAYLVGRLRIGNRYHPLVFSIHNGAKGLRVDALLTTVEQVRVLFSYSRAYFHVETECPGQLVTFLQEVMPHKRLAELYIGLGYHKHGKTELYRDLLKHQQVCSLDRFDFSPGKPGMVMIAFNMPNDDLIYKLIRDRFDAPKKTSAQQVMEKYDFVFRHDRAGRLLDFQTFENLMLEDCCFTPQLLDEIRNTARHAASVGDGHVVLKHAYVERRVTPLDIVVQTADRHTAKAAVLDYGQAIKDLAQVNIFPGDMLLKNFGITDLGRVVFYDYDELRPLTECNFRRLPQARRYDDDLDAEPWYMVDENDVFPEEFAAFLGFPSDLRDVFLKHHGDLLKPEFWWRTQDQIRSGDWIHIRPYGGNQRLRRNE